MLRPYLPILPLSYGLQSLLVSKDGEALTAERIATAALQIFPEEQVRSGLEDLCRRLGERIQKLAESEGESTSGERKTLGYELQQWARALQPDALCLLLADFDPVKAHHLYWRVDSDLLDLALREKLRFLAQQQYSAYEANLYGFGGKYSDDSSGEQAASGDFSDLTDFGFGFVN